MSIFKACDIRGVFDKELKAKDAFNIGCAFGTMIEGKNIVVGGDVRLSTPLLKQELMKGLCRTGCQVIDIGILPTPALYFSKNKLNTYAGVMVTASHNPANYNGFKISFGDMPVKEVDIERLRDLTKTKDFCFRSGGSIKKHFMITEYRDFVLNYFKKCPSKDIKVVIDAGNGVCGPIATEVFRNLNYEVVPLYCDPDGNFPNREPNPALAENLQALRQKVVEEKAHFGIGFDGDGDRVAFVDEKGEVLASEKVIIIFAKYLIEKHGPGTVVYDHKCSTIVEKEISKLKGSTVREKSGHAFIKRNFLKSEAIMAGEISGHYFFKDIKGDDGLFASLIMATLLREKGKSLSDLASQIPQYYITPDIRIPYMHDDKNKLLEIVKQKFSQYPIDTLDGVRIIFPNGWGLIRISVTEPMITMRFEGDTHEDMQKIKSEFLNAVPKLKQIMGDRS